MILLLKLLGRLPLPVVHLLGVLIGHLFWWLPSKRKRIALRNIAVCLPELPPAAQRRLARRALVHEANSLLESPRLWIGPASGVTALVREVRGVGLVETALARGKGVIIAAPHLGAWEVVGLECSRQHPMTSLYKPQKGAWEPFIRRGRERFGARLVPSEHGGVRQLLQALRRDEMIGILPDQDPPRGSGVYAPFLGVNAHTPVLLQRLARRTGAIVIFVYAERLPWGRGFVLHHLPAPDGILDEDEIRAAAAVNAGVEMCVRRHPEQYWWGYARFRRRPPGEPGFYKKT